jgi:anthranilate synthase component 1
LADLQTPVSIYLKVRDLYPQSALLESSDYHSAENSFSYIGVEPIARFSVKNGVITEQLPDGEIVQKSVAECPVPDALEAFVRRFETEDGSDTGGNNGFFGYTAYDAVRYFDPAALKDEPSEIPEMAYLLYRFVIAVDHFRNEMTVTENLTGNTPSKMDELLSAIDSRNFPEYGFSVRGGKSSTVTDSEFREMVGRGIRHCTEGDVTQIVLSRRFEQSFIGDDFKVYRALRSVNPSPYLFYFDFGSYRIFGSSPETHLKIKDGTATIDPIAGTFRRTGDDARDQQLARALLADPKENVEHEMLVDLARDDLSRHTTEVTVEASKEIRFYSHVIHMVSRVSGRVAPETNRIRLFADTFPAGTVSGAPRTRAMQLIDEIEPHRRGIYGGCIGHIGFDGDLNQAITIRTFVSRNNTLCYQAGAGIVAQSDPDKELQEVNNKLGALQSAIDLAGTF